MKLKCVHCECPTIECAALPPGWEPGRLTLLGAADIRSLQGQRDSLADGGPRAPVDYDALGLCPDCRERERPKPWEQPPGPKMLF